jgi:prophage regulatory protein
MAHDNDLRILVSLNAACRMTSLSRTGVNKARGEGRFPVEVSIGERRIAFVRSEVEAWIAARVAARDSKSRLASATAAVSA